MKDDIVLGIIIIGLVGVIAGGVVFMRNNARWEHDLQELARKSYNAQEDIRTEIRGKHCLATYSKEKDFISVIVDCENGRHYELINLNKSRIIGVYVGQRAKRMVDGVKEGWNTAEFDQ